MKIAIKNIKADNISLDVNSQATILNVKEIYSNIINKPCQDITLSYKGKILDDDKTLVDYDISDECQLIRVGKNMKKVVSKKVEPTEDTVNLTNNSDSVDFEACLNFAVETMYANPIINTMVNGDKSLLREYAIENNMDSDVMDMFDQMIIMLRTLINRDFDISEDDHVPLRYLTSLTGNFDIAVQSYIACDRDVAWAAMVSKDICSMMDLVNDE